MMVACVADADEKREEEEKEPREAEEKEGGEDEEEGGREGGEEGGGGGGGHGTWPSVASARHRNNCKRWTGTYLLRKLC